MSEPGCHRKSKVEVSFPRCGQWEEGTWNRMWPRLCGGSLAESRRTRRRKEMRVRERGLPRAPSQATWGARTGGRPAPGVLPGCEGGNGSDPKPQGMFTVSFHRPLAPLPLMIFHRASPTHSGSPDPGFPFPTAPQGDKVKPRVVHQAAVLKGGLFCPQSGIQCCLENFWLSQLVRGGGCRHLVGRGRGCCFPQCPAQTSQRRVIQPKCQQKPQS